MKFKVMSDQLCLSPLEPCNNNTHPSQSFQLGQREAYGKVSVSFHFCFTKIHFWHFSFSTSKSVDQDLIVRALVLVFSLQTASTFLLFVSICAGILMAILTSFSLSAMSLTPVRSLGSVLQSTQDRRHRTCHVRSAI